MMGGRVCHAHGGRAPRVRAAAARRLAYAGAYRWMSVEMARQEDERAAVALWAPEVRDLARFGRWEVPRSVKRLRAIAREMEATARTIRVYARELSAEQETL